MLLPIAGPPLAVKKLPCRQDRSHARRSVRRRRGYCVKTGVFNRLATVATLGKTL